MQTPEESEWIATPQSTDICLKQDGSYRHQGDSGFHSITPTSGPSIHDSHFQQCPRCCSEFEISLNISNGSNTQTPGTNNFVGKPCHGCVRDRKLGKNFLHSESPYLVPFKPVHLLSHNDLKTVSLCTPGSSDVSIDTSLYMEDEMETDQFAMETDNSSFNESIENNVMELKCEDHFVSETSVTSNYVKVPAPVSETTGAKKKCYLRGQKFSTSPEKNKTLKTRVEFGMIRDLPRRRDNKQSRVKAKQSMFRNKYFQPLPIVTSLVGLENIDILYQLQQAQLGLIISKIFEYVEDRDLVSVMKVSKTWKEICLNDHAACNRLRKAPERNAARELCFKENLYFRQKKIRSLERTLRGQLLQITNHQASPPRVRPPEPMSPHRNSWRYLALNEKEKVLNNNEKMMSCPRCRNPARDPRNGMPVKCFRIGCQYEFCSICKSEYKEGHTCVLLSTPRSRKYTQIGSVASKRNLRRL